MSRSKTSTETSSDTASTEPSETVPTSEKSSRGMIVLKGLDAEGYLMIVKDELHLRIGYVNDETDEITSDTVSLANLTKITGTDVKRMTSKKDSKAGTMFRARDAMASALRAGYITRDVFAAAFGDEAPELR